MYFMLSKVFRFQQPSLAYKKMYLKYILNFSVMKWWKYFLSEKKVSVLRTEKNIIKVFAFLSRLL